jgi:hypothetical protein
MLAQDTNFLRFRPVTSVAFAVVLQTPAFSQTAAAEHRQLIRFQALRPLSFHDLVGLTAEYRCEGRSGTARCRVEH